MPEPEPLLFEPSEVDIGIPGVILLHTPSSFMTDTGLPVDGQWSVVWAATSHRINRAPFRTLHAAAHYALRVTALPEGLGAVASLAAGAKPTSDFLASTLHAEKHAHDCDAAYPAGTVIVMGNGPSIIDDCGTTRQFITQTPMLETKRNDDGEWRCVDCGDPSAHIWADQ